MEALQLVGHELVRNFRLGAQGSAFKSCSTLNLALNAGPSAIKALEAIHSCVGSSAYLEGLGYLSSTYTCFPSQFYFKPLSTAKMVISGF